MSLEAYYEGSSFVDLAGRADTSSEGFNLCLDKEQSHSAGFLMIMKGFVQTKKFVAELFHVDTPSVVAHSQLDMAICYGRLEVDRGFAAG